MDISETFINDANLSKQDLHILRPGYLEKEVSCFTKVITEDKVEQIVEKLEVSDSKEVKKGRETYGKRKKTPGLPLVFLLVVSVSFPLLGLCLVCWSRQLLLRLVPLDLL